MLLSPRNNGLDSLFKEVRVLKALVGFPERVAVRAMLIIVACPSRALHSKAERNPKPTWKT